MARAIELFVTLLQLVPVVVLSINSNQLRSQLTPVIRNAQADEPENAALSS